MAHDKVYGVRENKCFVEVAPKEDVEKAQSTADGKVSKGGDTMTGSLTIENDSPRKLILKDTSISKSYKAWKQVGILNGSARDGTIGQIEIMRNTPGGHLGSGVVISAYNSTGTQQAISIYSFDDGVNQEAYVQHPSWKVGTNDNSDKSLTIKMANSLPSLVHTTGNETVAGVKTFSANPIVLKNSPYVILEDTKCALTDDITYNYNYGCIAFKDKNGIDIGRFTVRGYTDGRHRMYYEIFGRDGTSYSGMGAWVDANGNAYADAPATPSNATGTEIATAGWVNSKIESAKTGRIEKVELTVGEFANATGYQINGAQVGDIVHYHIKDILGHSFIGSFEIGNLISTEEVKYSVIGDDAFRIKLYSTNLGFWFQYFMNDSISETEFRGICALREV